MALDKCFYLLITGSQRIVVARRRCKDVVRITSNFTGADWRGTEDYLISLYNSPLGERDYHYRNILTFLCFGPKRMSDCKFRAFDSALRFSSALFTRFACHRPVDATAPRVFYD